MEFYYLFTNMEERRPDLNCIYDNIFLLVSSKYQTRKKALSRGKGNEYEKCENLKIEENEKNERERETLQT